MFQKKWILGYKTGETSKLEKPQNWRNLKTFRTGAQT